jgi:hypothetical protein
VCMPCDARINYMRELEVVTCVVDVIYVIF